MPDFTEQEYETLAKGVLDSIKNMLSRRPKAQPKGPSAQEAVRATAPKPQAPAPLKLSGRAEDHTYHAEGLTHLLQTSVRASKDDRVHAALTHLRTAHENMGKARAAYEKGDHAAAHKYLLGAKAYRDHAVGAHAHTVAFHGDVLESRMKELGAALKGQHNADPAAGQRALAMAKADGGTDYLAYHRQQYAKYAGEVERLDAAGQMGSPQRDMAAGFANAHHYLGIAHAALSEGDHQGARNTLQNAEDNIESASKRMDAHGVDWKPHLTDELRASRDHLARAVNDARMSKAEKEPFRGMVMGFYRSR